MALKSDYFPIRYIVAETGVNPVTLRAWERRYGLIKPKRTAKGHRLYSFGDILLIKQILFFLAKGHPVSKVKFLLENEQQVLLGDGLKTSFATISEAIEARNQKSLRVELAQLNSLYSAELFADFVYPELLQYLENSCWLGRGYTGSLRNFLLDCLAAELYRNLYQQKSWPSKKAFLVIGYRTDIAPTLFAVHTLLIANTLKSYEHPVDYISSVDSFEELYYLARSNKDCMLITVTALECFLLKKMLSHIKSNGIENLTISFLPQLAASMDDNEDRILLPKRFSDLYNYLTPSRT